MPMFDVVVFRYQLTSFFMEANTEEEAKKIALGKQDEALKLPDEVWDNDDYGVVSVDLVQLSQ